MEDRAGSCSGCAYHDLKLEDPDDHLSWIGICVPDPESAKKDERCAWFMLRPVKEEGARKPRRKGKK